MQLIEISTLALLRRPSPSAAGEDEIVTDAGLLKALDGRTVDDVRLADLLEDSVDGSAILDLGLVGGTPVLEFDATTASLRCTMRLRCDRPLSTDQLALLHDAAQAQFLDGFGSNPLALDAPRGAWVAICAGPVTLKTSRAVSPGRAARSWSDRLLGAVRGRSPIFTAIAAGDLAAARRLIAASKAHVNATDRWDCTPLMLATRDGHTALALELLERGASPVHRSSANGSAALDFAAMAGDVTVGRALLMAGAEIDGRGTGSDGYQRGATALMWAANRSHPAFVRMLLDAGAAIDLQDDTGQTAAHYVALRVDGGDLPTLELLVAAGADLAIAETRGRTLIDVARAQARGGRPELRQLIEQHRPQLFGTD